NDIMAGLCRSIIENVFTKVVRISNTADLGDHIVVQGGTFRNRAVLRALEEYLGKEVTLAPYPGEMGAFGAALLAKRELEENIDLKHESAFIGIDAVRQFSYTTETGVRCPLCANHCSRTIMRFSTSGSWVTGNRCERGAVVSDNSLSNTGKATTLESNSGESLSDHSLNVSTTIQSADKPAPDLFLEREQMLFADYPYTSVVTDESRGIVGLPRVLEFWDSMPFWSTFFRALGYTVKFSHKSSQKLYENGLTFVASDTICFPAKLAHGHVQDLAEQGVDRIFMPYVMHMPPEGKDKLSPYVCSVVQGYPMVVRNAQSPEERYGVVFDTPTFHFFQEKDRKPQVCRYAVETLGVTKKQAREAYDQAEAAIKSFRSSLTERASQIMKEASENGTFAVVLAGRPYHNDAFVSHGISQIFAKKGVPVLTADSLPGLNEVDLSNTRIEITNNFHTRMLSAAVLAAQKEELEYVQLVSFGCGHDAVLSDEIIRIMNEIAKKPPLILKIDESDASGSLGIRIQSFVETIKIRRSHQSNRTPYPLPAPSPVKFYKADKKKRTLLVPNISAEVSVLLDAILEKEGFTVKTIPIGSTEQIRLGKQYVHNDICFPCQMVIGELISELKTGNYKQDEVAVAMVKFQCDCRMSHYAGLLRKGLDAAGFTEVPVVTTDVNDTKKMHPGVFLLGISAVLEAVWGFMMLDIVMELGRKIRPYEMNPGQTDQVCQNCVQRIADGIRSGISTARKEFAKCIDDIYEIPYDRSHLKPLVFVTGELLVTYHPGSNFHIERYLEQNGMETAFPRVMDQLRKDFQASMSEISQYHANIPPYPFAVDFLFNSVQKDLEKTARKHPLFVPGVSPRKLYEGVSDIIPETLSCGEGWLMAAEIAHYAEEGAKTFIILQPFGCLPNHICGRGVIRKLKSRYPDIQILPLDLDPDTSYANVENRLQMLLMNTTGQGD
ncbi:MAG: acyl-CoA dehydratase activase-related protein, partial [Clostridiales bacterium]|nr:acyl-CoA dehydratase activase-related protein [Clostridiales bacterium]